MSQPISTKKTEAVHYRYKLNKEKTKAFYKLESTDGYKASINGFIVAVDHWSIPRLHKIEFRTFANTKGSTETGIIDEELFIPASGKCISLNGVKYDVSPKEVETIYTYEKLLSLTHNELKEIAEDYYGIKGHFRTEKLREEIIRAQREVIQKDSVKEVDQIKEVETLKPQLEVLKKPIVTDKKPVVKKEDV